MNSLWSAWSMSLTEAEPVNGATAAYATQKDLAWQRAHQQRPWSS
jgi:hypothetical protein